MCDFLDVEACEWNSCGEIEYPMNESEITCIYKDRQDIFLGDQTSAELRSEIKPCAHSQTLADPISMQSLLSGLGL